ncbi:MAG: NAD(P)-dependent oxidoreductase [Anaerolineales bacterium]|nr:NAD(P)-dependent oxidoreductase [Anaerolineales bacterium]
MRTIVTGGAGFLGSHLADELSARGHHVTVFDRKPSAELGPNQAQVAGDLNDFDLLCRTLAGMDYVYHYAALSDLNRARELPRETVRVNVEGTVNVLEAARRAGVKRFVFSSTIYVYSDEGSFYRASKQACEAYIEEYQRRYGLEYTILRFGSLYGPRADESNGLYRLLREAARTGRIRYFGEPEDAREYIHVADAARLSVDILAPDYANQHLVITGHYPTRARDLFTMFSEILGREVKVEYAEPEIPDGHYRITPYHFHPRVGKKLTSNLYVDFGQGILQVLEQISREERK